MTTVTLPREVAEYAAHYFEVNGETTDEAIAAKEFRAALDAPAQPVDCRGCKNSVIKNRSTHAGFNCINCTDFDKFQALPPIVLTKVTK